MYEELVGRDEECDSTSHASIKILKSNHQESFEQIERKLESLIDLKSLDNRESLIKKLKDLVPEYSPYSKHNNDLRELKPKNQEIMFKMPIKSNKRLISTEAGYEVIVEMFTPPFLKHTVCHYDKLCIPHHSSSSIKKLRSFHRSENKIVTCLCMQVQA